MAVCAGNAPAVGLRRNWARMVGWRMIRDREGDMRELEVGMVEVVVLGQLVAGMEGDGGAVGSDGLQVVEDGGAVMEGRWAWSPRRREWVTWSGREARGSNGRFNPFLNKCVPIYCLFFILAIGRITVWQGLIY